MDVEMRPRTYRYKTPFEIEHSLNNELRDPAETPLLPGYPHISLEDTQELTAFLERDVCAPTLEAMAPRLWWMSKQSSAHVWPLHHQAVKLRNIVISENPELHLVWYYDRIFIKPLPKYLLSFEFWNTYLASRTSPLGPKHETIRRSALGLLRTYQWLVQYESDFDIAIEKRLLPKTTSWESYSRFVSDLRKIEDDDVTGRYAFGEIRLSRLNFYIKILLWKSTFHKVDGQYGAYFARFYAPLFFIFAMGSLLLSALQLEVAEEPFEKTQWHRIWGFSRWTSILMVVLVLWLAFALLLLLLLRITMEWYYAFRDRRQIKNLG